MSVILRKLHDLHDGMGKRHRARFLLIFLLGLALAALPARTAWESRPLGAMDVPTPPAPLEADQAPTVPPSTSPLASDADVRQALNDHAQRLDQLAQNADNITSAIDRVSGALLEIVNELRTLGGLVRPLKLLVVLGIVALSIWIVERLGRYVMLAFTASLAWALDAEVVRSEAEATAMATKSTGNAPRPTLIAPWFPKSA